MNGFLRLVVFKIRGQRLAGLLNMAVARLIREIQKTQLQLQS